MQAVRSCGTLPKVLSLCTFLLFASCLITSCGGGSIAVDLGSIAAISAPNTTLRVTQTTQLSSKWMSAGQPIDFYVNGILGGSAEVGTISSTGLSLHPRLFPHPIPYRSRADSTVSDCNAWLSENPGMESDVSSSVTPTGFSEGTTTVLVERMQFVYGATITWNGVVVPTTYVLNTELVTQISAPNPGVIRYL